jgi:3-oxoacyl-[acyl-carrier protein] reductase
MRNVVVSGGGTGIGLTTSKWFADAGDQVSVLGRRANVLEEAARSLGATAVVCDVADPRSVHEALDALPSRIDVLVNNAGGNTDLAGSPSTDGAPNGDVEELDAVRRAWQANLDANLLSAVLLTTALQSRLAEDGRVITIGSIAARTGAGSYGAAKAAVEVWSAELAGGLGPRGITVNVVSPGLTTGTEFFNGRLSSGRAARLGANTATKRAGTPDDIAATIGFLASPQARHVTAQVIHVNGGAYQGR